VTPLQVSARARLGALFVCCAMLPQLTGCSLYNRVFHRHRTTGCTEKPFAQNTATRPLLKVPAGLSAADTRNAIKIPDLNTPERVRSKTEPCLAQPPSFAIGKPVAEPTAVPGAPPITEMKPLPVPSQAPSPPAAPLPAPASPPAAPASPPAPPASPPDSK
jgi:hypothetical protein